MSLAEADKSKVHQLRLVGFFSHYLHNKHTSKKDVIELTNTIFHSENKSISTWTSLSTNKKALISEFHFHTETFMQKHPTSPNLVAFGCFFLSKKMTPHPHPTGSRCSERPHNHYSHWSNYQQWNSLHGPLPKVCMGVGPKHSRFTAIPSKRKISRRPKNLLRRYDWTPKTSPKVSGT